MIQVEKERKKERKKERRKKRKEKKQDKETNQAASSLDRIKMTKNQLEFDQKTPFAGRNIQQLW